MGRLSWDLRVECDTQRRFFWGEQEKEKWMRRGDYCVESGRLNYSWWFIVNQLSWKEWLSAQVRVFSWFQVGIDEFLSEEEVNTWVTTLLRGIMCCGDQKEEGVTWYINQQMYRRAGFVTSQQIGGWSRAGRPMGPMRRKKKDDEQVSRQHVKLTLHQASHGQRMGAPVPQS